MRGALRIGGRRLSSSRPALAAPCSLPPAACPIPEFFRLCVEFPPRKNKDLTEKRGKLSPPVGPAPYWAHENARAFPFPPSRARPPGRAGAARRPGPGGDSVRNAARRIVRNRAGARAGAERARTPARSFRTKRKRPFGRGDGGRDESDPGPARRRCALRRARHDGERMGSDPGSAAQHFMLRSVRDDGNSAESDAGSGQRRCAPRSAREDGRPSAWRTGTSGGLSCGRISCARRRGCRG
ncbi:hypothetical protein SAMN06297382_1042 [Amphiplicatus metriothermophilus]|uniref:Uncharacterized protein n=1 Tax=Amphiplicatus metriothermophilus TaxID=1519374 RepID=A0A239PNX5_9PROT|nr:hypothetical protein [Amphiplicatus metriothermophilus]SNT72019.1 hypothetical protein SAMN06297382_1042 [Amphiplicatus metriothermophilus]